MSYGRSPYHIIGTRGHNGSDVIQFMEPAGSIERGEFPYTPTGPGGTAASPSVSDDAIAQFLVHLAARGTETLQAWITRGAHLDRDYSGFVKRHPDDTFRKSEEAYSRFLQSIRVTVSYDKEALEEIDS